MKAGRWEAALIVFCIKYCWDEKFKEVACCLRRGNDEKAIQSFFSENLQRWSHLEFVFLKEEFCRSQWPRGLRRRSEVTRLLRLWVRIPLGAWMSVCCECCVLSGRGLCDELITRPEDCYRLWCVVLCDLETSRMKRPWPVLGHSATAGRAG